jgi:hypothetical protein
VKTDLRLPMERYGVAALIGEENMYATLPTAVAAYREWAEAHPAPEPSTPTAPTAGGRDPHEHPRSTLAALGLHRFARVHKPRPQNAR